MGIIVTPQSRIIPATASINRGMSQAQYDFMQSDASNLAVVAGYGSGKTFIACMKILALLDSNRGQKIGYIAPTYTVIRDVFYPTMGAILDAHRMPYTINKTDKTITIESLGHIICRTMERPELIVGYEVIAMVYDEFDVPKIARQKEVYNKGKARIRQPRKDGKDGQSIVATTPEGFKHTYNLFKKDPLEGSQLVQMSTYSNADNLPVNYIPDLIEMYPPNLVKAYIKGDFVNLVSGSVYTEFDRKTCHASYTPDGTTLHMGNDFNVQNVAGIFGQFRNGVLYIFKEMLGVYDSPALVTLIKRDYPLRRKILAYPDASGKNRHSSNASTSDHRIISEVSTLRVNPSNPAVKDRVLALNQAFKNGLIKIDTNKCPELTECIEQQIYDKNGVPDKEAGLDHPLDAIGYLNFWHHSIIKPQFSYGIGTAA